MKYIINHSLRTLIKSADQQALEMLGYSFNPNINITPLILNKNQINIGEQLEFSFTIKAKEETPLMIDYIIYFQTKLGKQNPKVFKLKKITLPKDKRITLTKKHLFKANSTTRTLYKGKQKIALQINGKIYEGVEFLLG